MDPATRLLAGGFVALAIVMGVGRFLYTPLLPLMQREFGFGPDVAGLLAGANFAGYLFGSLLASALPSGPMQLRAFQLGLIVSVATTLGMGLTDAVGGWLVLRTLAGVASAVSLIIAAGIAAAALAEIGDESRIGWMFGGIGFGIAVSGLLVVLANPYLDASTLWVVAGLASAVFLPFPLQQVRRRQLIVRPRRAGRPRRLPRPLPFPPLLLNYFCEGLGYSVFATFIVAIVKSRPGAEPFGDWVWTAAGVAGLPSCPIWGWIADRVGFARALVLAYLAQIAGVLLAALSSAGWAALLGAVLFGGTFMAITVLTIPLGRHALGGRGFAVLTAGFGLGQMLGPLAAGYLVARPADFDAALLISAAVLIVGTAFLVAAMTVRSRSQGRRRRWSLPLQ